MKVNTLNTNIAINKVKYINVNYSKYDCASFSTYVKGNLSWFVELKQYTVCVYFKQVFLTAFLNLSLQLQVGMLVLNCLLEEMLHMKLQIMKGE